MTGTVDLDGRSLTAATVQAVAQGCLKVRIAPSALARVQRAHEVARQVVNRRPVYGRTTGVGANRAVEVPESDAHGLRLLRSHAAGAGPRLPAELVRAALGVRLNQLLAGGSGVSPEVAVALVQALNSNSLPRVRQYGGVGTGDLPALADIALTLAGELPWTGTSMVPTTFGATDALAFVSSNAVSLGCAALAYEELRRLVGSSLEVAALSYLAAGGNGEAISAAVAVVTPFPGAVAVAERLSGLLVELPEAARIQDPYAFRTLPQTLGLVVESLGSLEDRLNVLLNAPCENPLVDPEQADVVHHGGFELHYLTAALDALRLALAKSVGLSQARIGHLLDPRITGLPAFLAGDVPGSSGLMAVEYATASALARVRHLANPVSPQTAVLSGGAEEDASFAGLAAELTLEMADPCRTVVAGELVTAVRALRMRGMHPAGAVLAGLFDEVTTRLPDSLEDRRLSGDIDVALDLLARRAPSTPQEAPP